MQTQSSPFTGVVDPNGFLGLSEDVWINVVSDLALSVVVLGGAAFVFRKIQKRSEERFRRYERSLKASRLYARYIGVLFAVDRCAKSVGRASLATLESIKTNTDQELDKVAASQLASIEMSESKVSDDLIYMQSWFEENFSAFPVERFDKIHELEKGVEEFIGSVRSSFFAMSLVRQTAGQRAKTLVMFQNQDYTLQSAARLEHAARRFPELFTHALGDYVIDRRQLKESPFSSIKFQDSHRMFMESFRVIQKLSEAAWKAALKSNGATAS